VLQAPFSWVGLEDKVIRRQIRATTAETNRYALAASRRAQIAEEALSLSGSLNVHRTVLRLIALFRPRLADWATLVMPDSVTGGLVLFGGNDAGFSTVVARDSAVGLGLDRVLRTGRTERHGAADALCADGLSSLVPYEPLRAEAMELRPGAALGLGLTARGTTLGALVLVRGDGGGFDDSEVAFVEGIASRAAMALASACTYEERSIIASELQQRLRPRTLPHIDGVRLAGRYRPAAEHLDIGGDFYDVFGSGNDWLISLGDVCGKGVEAAVLTDRTRQSIRTAAHFDRSPTTVLGALNSVIHEAGFDRFVTVVCARMRTVPSGSHIEIEVAAAGHPGPIVLRADGRVEQVEVSGTAIGLRPNVSYHAAAIRLNRGDAMLMFTDGVDEARGDDGFYGMDRLMAFLSAYVGASPEVICEAVEQNVVEFLDGRSHDDIALLALTCGA
jgi:sigma-B regulation protein RsbU (phosphoserine phosphatase)